MNPHRLARNSPDWEALYLAYLPRIYAYVAARVEPVQDAEDVTARVFLKAIHNQAQFVGKHADSLAAWLFVIARHAISDHYRQMARQEQTSTAAPPPDSLPAAHPSPEMSLEQAEQAAELRHLIQALPERRQEVILLRYFGGLKNQEIAHVLEVNERTVAAYISRALRELHARYITLEKVEE